MHNSPVYAGLTLFTIFEKKFNFRGKNVFSTLNFPLFSGTYSVIFDDGVEFEATPARMDDHRRCRDRHEGASELPRRFILSSKSFIQSRLVFSVRGNTKLKSECFKLNLNETDAE